MLQQHLVVAKGGAETGLPVINGLRCNFSTIQKLVLDCKAAVCAKYPLRTGTLDTRAP